MPHARPVAEILANRMRRDGEDGRLMVQQIDPPPQRQTSWLQQLLLALATQVLRDFLLQTAATAIRCAVVLLLAALIIHLTWNDGAIGAIFGYLLKLEHSLYGLKQSPRCWYQTFHDYLLSIGFAQATADACVYVKKEDTLSVIALYVDDLIVLTEGEAEMQQLKARLAKRFKMKDMGELHYCLGISVVQDKGNKSISLHQKQYILSMLEKYGMTQAKTVATPADSNVKLEKDDSVSKKVDSTRYQSMVGSLLYAAIATRPDIAQAVGAVSKFNADPSEAHLTAAKRILCYLKGTSDLGLKFEKNEASQLIGFSDADWAGDLNDRHSTSGTLYFLAGGALSWLSKKQATALSTAEVEYIALSLVWPYRKQFGCDD